VCARKKRKTARVLWVCDARGEKDRNNKKKSDDVLLFFLSLKSVRVCARARARVRVTFFLVRFQSVRAFSLFLLSFSSLSLFASFELRPRAFARARARARAPESWVDFGEGTFKSETERYFL
jgi:hypothetical protein